MLTHRHTCTSKWIKSADKKKRTKTRQNARTNERKEQSPTKAIKLK